MPDLSLLSPSRMSRIAMKFPVVGSASGQRRRVRSRAMNALKNGLQRQDALSGYWPHKTLYNWFGRWTEMGVFGSIFSPFLGKAT